MPQAQQGLNISDSAQIQPGVVESSDIKDGDIVAADLATDAVETAKIKDLNVTTAKIADANVTEDKVADNAITLAKMAGGTDGNLITYDTNGDPVAVATGTAGQVLTSNGAGAAPTFQASGIEGIWVPLTESSQAHAVITNAGMETATGSAAGSTPMRGSAFIPTGTISSIQLLYFSEGGSAGNIVFKWEFFHITDDEADTSDTINETVAAHLTNGDAKLQTVDPTAYDGLTQGKIWSFTVTRLGDDGADTYASDIRMAGILVNF